MSSRIGFQATDLALVAVFAALIAVLAVIPPIFMVGAVPFALQMIAVMLTPMVLGSVRGGCAHWSVHHRRRLGTSGVQWWGQWTWRTRRPDGWFPVGLAAGSLRGWGRGDGRAAATPA